MKMIEQAMDKLMPPNAHVNGHLCTALLCRCAPGHWAFCFPAGVQPGQDNNIFSMYQGSSQVQGTTASCVLAMENNRYMAIANTMSKRVSVAKIGQALAKTTFWGSFLKFGTMSRRREVRWLVSVIFNPLKAQHVAAVTLWLASHWTAALMIKLTGPLSSNLAPARSGHKQVWAWCSAAPTFLALRRKQLIAHMCLRTKIWRRFAKLRLSLTKLLLQSTALKGLGRNWHARLWWRRTVSAATPSLTGRPAAKWGAHNNQYPLFSWTPTAAWIDFRHLLRTLSSEPANWGEHKSSWVCRVARRSCHYIMLEGHHIGACTYVKLVRFVLFGVSQGCENGVFGKRCFCLLPKTRGFDEKWRKWRFTFYPQKQGVVLLRARKPTKMTKMAGVPPTRPGFTKNRVFATLSFFPSFTVLLALIWRIFLENIVLLGLNLPSLALRGTNRTLVPEKSQVWRASYVLSYFRHVFCPMLPVVKWPNWTKNDYKAGQKTPKDKSYQFHGAAIGATTKNPRQTKAIVQEYMTACFGACNATSREQCSGGSMGLPGSEHKFEKKKKTRTAPNSFPNSSSPERWAKSLSHSLFVVPFPSLNLLKCSKFPWLFVPRLLTLDTICRG